MSGQTILPDRPNTSHARVGGKKLVQVKFYSFFVKSQKFSLVLISNWKQKGTNLGRIIIGKVPIYFTYPTHLNK